MKTPEEIKKGLECCIFDDPVRCDECPYMPEGPSCSKKLLSEAFAQFDKVPKWISVKDDLPALVITSCFIYADGWIQVADWSHDRLGMDWWFYVDGEYEPEVTHWMPLPEPPKEG